MKDEIVPYPGFRDNNQRVLDWMIAFIGTSITVSLNYNNS
jgi:hypothetical protein